VVPFSGGDRSEIVLRGWNYLDGLSWTPDGKGFYLTSWSPRGSTILRVALSGEAQIMYQSSSWIPRVIPSPDGRYLAFAFMVYDSSAWLMER
jgi:dipeptidyl aminopeptidase/acylaminoacyl peptidase